MSVPVSQRNETKLLVHQKTEDMILHTIQIVQNEKIFVPAFKRLSDMVVELAIEIGMDLWEANGIYVGNDAKKWENRYELENRACRNFDVMLYLLTLCRKAFHLRTRKYNAWVEKVITARNLAKKWRDSDVRRYGGLNVR